MKINKNEYKNYVKRMAERSPVLKDCFLAYIVGGAVCVIGQGFFELFSIIGFEKEQSGTFVSITLIFISALLTCIGVFDKIAKHAGAGTLVPITGFANSIVSPALDNKAEGFILGVGAKMFTIAGPVIVYGTVASVVYGVIYWITTLF